MFSLIGLFFALASLVSSNRIILANGTGGVSVTGSTQPPCYVISAKYQTLPSGAKGDIFAAVMGSGAGGVLFPWAAMGYVKGSVDMSAYSSQPSNQVVVDASGAVMFWAWVAVGEYCNVDGVPGYQSGGGDYIIYYYDSTQANAVGGFTETCSKTANADGSNSYTANVQTTTGNYFLHRCTVVDEAHVQNSVTIDDYSVKCDIAINYTALWATSALLVKGCTDGNRYVGAVLDVAASAFAVTVKNANLASMTSLTSGALSFNWPNTYYRDSTPLGFTGAIGTVTASYVSSGSNAYAGATLSERIIFSFDQPKSTGTGIYTWDPTITASGQSLMVSLCSLLILSISYFLC